MYQPIVGFHQDEHNDWVARLGCLHYQHVRHNPPWVNRAWVVSNEGRAGKIGRMLKCVKCSNDAPTDHKTSVDSTEPRMPSGLASYRKTPVFDQDTVPVELQQEHATAGGVWALLRVLSGSLAFCHSEDGRTVCYEVTPANPRVIAAEQKHHIVVSSPVCFELEFFH